MEKDFSYYVEVYRISITPKLIRYFTDCGCYVINDDEPMFYDWSISNMIDEDTGGWLYDYQAKSGYIDIDLISEWLDVSDLECCIKCKDKYYSLEEFLNFVYQVGNHIEYKFEWSNLEDNERLTYIRDKKLQEIL